MKHRYYIPIISIVVAIVLLVGIKRIFEKNTRTIFNQQMNVYTNFIDIQSNTCQQLQQKTVAEIFNELRNDDQLSALISDVDGNTFFEKSQKSTKSNNTISKLLKLTTKNGFSSLKFYTPKNNIIEIQAFPDSSVNFSKIDSFHCFNFENEATINSTGLNFILTLPVLSNNKKVVFVELTISFDALKKMINKKYDETSIGLLITGVNDSLKNELVNSRLFKSNAFIDNSIVDFNFDLEQSFWNDKKCISEIAENFEIAKRSYTNHSFSNYYNNGKTISILSFSPIFTSNPDQKIYIVIKNNEPFLMTMHNFNRRFFWLIASIIITVVIFLNYLYINRLQLLLQKQQIQKTVEVLNELNSTKNKFFSIIAHDLKNPFNGIMGMSTYLVDSYSEVDDNERKEIISDINIASKDAFNLLQNLLEWTRSQTGLIRMKPTIFTPDGVIDLALETVVNLAKKKKIKIEKQITTTHSGYADENMVTVVVRNLATNAVKFSPKNSTIIIEVKDFKDKIVFMIIDKGIGLRSEEIDKLFRIENSFHKKGTDNESGSGLGLILCKEFVERCGGQLWVVSDFGVGSTFYFTIPRFLGKS